jgi:hypothetical protein
MTHIGREKRRLSLEVGSRFATKSDRADDERRRARRREFLWLICPTRLFGGRFARLRAIADRMRPHRW